MFSPQVYLIPLISALVGWITNVLAIKLIFRPYQPLRVPVFGWKIQGVLPKRRVEMARQIGQVVAEQLLSSEEIVAQLLKTETRDRAVMLLTLLLRRRLTVALPGYVPGVLVRKLGDVLENVIRKEAPALIDRLEEELRDSLRRDIRLAEIVEQKLLGFPLAELEHLVVTLAGRELRAIELFGGVLGFLIGIIQVLLLVLG